MSEVLRLLKGTSGMEEDQGETLPDSGDLGRGLWFLKMKKKPPGPHGSQPSLREGRREAPMPQQEEDALKGAALSSQFPARPRQRAFPLSSAALLCRAEQTPGLRLFPGSLPHFFLRGQVCWRPVSHFPTQHRLTDREACLLPWPSPLPPHEQCPAVSRQWSSMVPSWAVDQVHTSPQ